MSERRRVSTLQQWFDAAVVVGARTDAAQHLANTLSVFGTAAFTPGDRRLSSTPAEAAQALRDAGVLRPLLWIEEGDPAAWAEALRSAFRVDARQIAGRTSDPSSPSADLTIVTAGSGAPAPRSVAWPDKTNFAPVETAILAEVERLLNQPKNLNVLVLYDDNFAHIKTIEEHLRSFSRYSRFNYFYLPASDPDKLLPAVGEPWPQAWDFSVFDVVIWHYSIRAAFDWHVPTVIRQQLRAFDGLKVVFTQDDYDNTDTTWNTIRSIGAQLVLNCIPPEGLAYVFPEWKPGAVEFVRTITGFVPEDDMDRFLVPMAQRDVRLAYRGRFLAYRYGTLGREKYLIGARMKVLADQRRVNVDIELDEDSRIYGDDWYRFTAAARATLASESGSNVFDRDGSITAASDRAMRNGTPYAEFYAEHLADSERHVRMNQVSPRIFEAVRLRTALICFEGDYSDVIQPNLHYIPLAKDFSNADEVFDRLEDVEALEAMTERAYRDVIESGRWSHERFVRDFDDLIERRLLRSTGMDIVSAPVALRNRRSGAAMPVPQVSGLHAALGDTVLARGFERAELAAVVEAGWAIARETQQWQVTQPAAPPSDAWTLFRVPCASLYRVGATQVKLRDGRADIEADGEPWAYVAQAALDISDIVREHEHVWLTARFSDVSGHLLAGSYCPEIMGGISEVPIATGPGPVAVHIKVRREDTTFLIRRGNAGERATARFLGAEVVSSPAYAPSMVAVARALQENGVLRPTISGMATPPPAEIVQRRPVEPPPTAAKLELFRPGRTALASCAGNVIDKNGATAISGRLAPWQYFATLPIPIQPDLLHFNHVWLDLKVRAVKGDISVSLLDRAQNTQLTSQRLIAQSDLQRLVFNVPEEGAYDLLFHAYDKGGAVALELVAADLLFSSKYPVWISELAREITNQERPRGSGPTDKVQAVGAIDLSSTQTDPGWGSVCTRTPKGWVVQASSSPWAFAAICDIDAPETLLSSEQAWLAVEVAESAGDLRLAVWRQGASEIVAELQVPASKAKQTITLPLEPPGPLRLLVRGGGAPTDARLTLLNASLLTEPRFNEGLSP